MAQAKVRPCTEEEIFETQKKPESAKAKVIPINSVPAVAPAAMPICASNTQAADSSWIKRNQTALIIGGLIVAGVVVWYFWQEREKEKKQNQRKIK